MNVTLQHSFSHWLKLSLGTIVVCLSSYAWAQNFRIQTLPTQLQLPVANVHCIMQDSEGYMWYGTEGGLCRDNGYQIDVFRPGSATHRSYACTIQCFSEDQQGNIVLGTKDGVFVLDKKYFHIRQIPLSNNAKGGFAISAIYVDRKGNVWVGMEGQIVCLDKNYQVKRTYPCLLNHEPSDVSSFYEDKAGRLFATLWRNGMLIYNKKKQQFETLSWPLKSVPVQIIENTREHYYWILVRGDGIVKMKLDEKSRTCHIELQPDTKVSKDQSIGLSMLWDRQHDMIWVTTLDNLYAYYPDGQEQLKPFDLSHFVPGGKKILDGICQVRNGDIYVAGWTPHTFIISSEQTGMVRHAIQPIVQATGYPLLADRTVTDGPYIWVWQGRKGLTLYDKTTQTIKDIAWPAERNIARCGGTDSPQSARGVWAFHGEKVFRLGVTNGQVERTDIFALSKNETVSTLCEAQGALWVATNQALYHWSLTTHRLKKVTATSASALQITADKWGNAYLAMGAEGLYQVSPDGKKRLLSKGADESFIALAMAPDGTLWTSTYEGNVYHYLPDLNKLIRRKDMSSSKGNAIKSIAVDGTNHVWTLTDQEVCECVPENHSLRRIRNTDPFVDVDYFYALEMADQNVVCLDGAGAVIEVPSSAELNLRGNVIPQVSTARIADRKHMIRKGEKELSLRADEQSVTLYLTTFNYRHTADIRFAYKCRETNWQWVCLPEGSNAIQLNNLSKGTHQLWVKASDKNGCWGKPVQLITLRRAPFWWQTWWAIILYAMTGAGIAWAVWRLERRIHLLRKFIERRSQVRLNEIDMQRKDIATLQRDDDFLQRAIACTEQHISDTEYNVEALSTDMCMSRITLYHRIQALTGQSPTDFIRDIRLKKAATLLLQYPEAGVSDVARKVGYANPKYFSRRFKEKFGTLPSEYRQGQAHDIPPEDSERGSFVSNQG